jgi:hypothetical protein
MRIIQLTSLQGRKPIYLNIEAIGHFYEVEAEMKYGRVEKEKHTKVGVTTHNNGGFSVVESTKQILKLIEESRGK